ncbi:flagellar motor switch protein FliN/FliY [Lachnospiraceae bacterium YSD2013]|nr:flagellar motor switch phosphatase FliY [Lachnospiraceae bacterium]MBR5760504.1 flagellar motor switch phosphatase FliY [Lachnospiraceae bacterium]SCX08601.1 flagellar motor switch protein FliN/FliY [Lachnospiraceae bacterium YSD2013]
MDGMLSQDEINALLSGMDPGDMAGAATPDTGAPADAGVSPDDTLSDVEKDAVGEVANISMGSSATTLYSLVNRKVNITTPVVSMVNWQGVTGDYEKPCVFIQIHYTAGLDGSNILVLREHDVKVITDLMMGGDGTNTDGELGELHLSAISEAMNQMMGAAATSLSTMLGTMIDISPPDATLLDLTEYQNGEDISPFLGGTFVKVAFTMQIEDLVDSTIMQLYPLDFAKRLVKTFMDSTAPAEPEPAPAPAPQAAPTPQQQPQQQPQMQPGMGGMDQSMNGMPNMGMPNMGMGMPGMMMPGMMPNMQQMNVQPAQFQSFNPEYAAMQANENIGLIMDVPLNVTVELGRTSKSISEILDFAPGTIIELDKIAGEPIDVLVNGKFVAKGEVVVIEESFAVRITEIIK